MRHHLERVLRKKPGDAVSYTDGAGSGGLGRLRLEGVERGVEKLHPQPTPQIVVGVAPPRSTSRVRTLVEKVAELGCDRLVWLSTMHGEGRAPAHEKASAWAVAALQQSRGHHLLQIGGPVSMDHEWPRNYQVLVADRDGTTVQPDTDEATEGVVVVIGPESGFSPGEVPDGASLIRLGAKVLRVETAAIAAVALLAARR